MFIAGYNTSHFFFIIPNMYTLHIHYEMNNTLVNITGTVVGGRYQTTITKKGIIIISLKWTLLTLYVGTNLIKILEETLSCYAVG